MKIEDFDAISAITKLVFFQNDRIKLNNGRNDRSDLTALKGGQFLNVWHTCWKIKYRSLQ